MINWPPERVQCLWLKAAPSISSLAGGRRDEDEEEEEEDGGRQETSWDPGSMSPPSDVNLSFQGLY